MPSPTSELTGSGGSLATPGYAVFSNSTIFFNPFFRLFNDRLPAAGVDYWPITTRTVPGRLRNRVAARTNRRCAPPYHRATGLAASTAAGGETARYRRHAYLKTPPPRCRTAAFAPLFDNLLDRFAARTPVDRNWPQQCQRPAE
jgi:hypothetical protein